MKNTVEIRNKTNNKKIRSMLNKLNIKFVNSNEKVAYYYENINTGDIFSFNADITFYAASSIKILAVMYLLDNNVNLKEKMIINAEDVKPGSGIINQLKDFPIEYTIKDLIKLSLKESDNTAYIKLVNYIGKENYRKYGLSLGATHTLEGKDLFGIINCFDLRHYWEHMLELIDKYEFLKDCLDNPTYKIIDDKVLDNQVFYRKYGEFGIAYHEAGVVLNKNPYYLFILTQKGCNKKAMRFITKTAKKLNKIHNILN